MFNRNRQQCPNCGRDNPNDAKFCAGCGGRLGGGTRKCGHCGRENPGNAQFCGGCGRALEEAEAPQIERHRWSRREEDFAIRVEADDLPGLLKRGIQVMPGTTAMFIERGANRGQVPPGEYTLSTIGQRVRDWFAGNIPQTATVLLVDSSPTDLEFHLGGRFTKDPLPIGLSLRVQVNVEEPVKFLINVLKQRERLSIGDLQNYLYPQVVEAADRWLREHTLEDLTGRLDQRQRLELALEETLRTTFLQTGLRFLQVRTQELNLEPFEAITGQFAKANLIDRELAAKVRLAEVELSQAETLINSRVAEEQQLGAARQRLADAKTQNELIAARAEVEALEAREVLRQQAALKLEALRQAVQVNRAELDLDTEKKLNRLQHERILENLQKETEKVEVEERRAELNARLRQALLDDKSGEVRSQADFEKLLDTLDRDKLLREKERQDLLKTWREQGEDADRARAHTMARLEVERNYELRLAEVKLRGGVSREEQGLAIDLERQRAESSLAIEQQRAEAIIRRQGMENDFRRSQQQLDDLAQRERDLQAALNKARIAKEEMEVERLEAEMGIMLLEKMKAVRRNDDHQRELNRIEIKDKELEIDLKRQEREIDLHIRQAREQHILDMEIKRLEAEERQHQREFELDKLGKLGELGPEALISVSGAEQARLLADLQKTQALKGMSEDQILAIAAKDSPLVAEAFKEKYKAAAEGKLDEQERQMYERLMNERQAAQEELRKAQLEALKQAREDADKRAQDSARAWEQASAQTKDVADRALDRMADMGTAFARQAPPPTQPIIITNPSTPPVVIGGGASASTQAGPAGGEEKFCTNCGRKVAVSVKFCPHCGNKFEGVS